MKLVKLLFTSILLLVLTLGSLGVQAQAGGNLLSSKDLSTVKVDALTDAEISQIQAQLKQAGLTIDQVEQQAIAKGMSATEFAKLKAKLSSAKAGNTNKSPLTQKTRNKSTDLNSKTDSTSLDFFEPSKINPLIYGSELFAQTTTGYAGNENMATPLSYIIGPGDVLSLVVYGVQEYISDLIVSKEGRVQIANVGQVKVAGLSIEAATEAIKAQMAKTAYPSIKNGETKIAITVGDIRTVQVTVIGALKSGKLNVSSFSLSFF